MARQKTGGTRDRRSDRYEDYDDYEDFERAERSRRSQSSRGAQADRRHEESMDRRSAYDAYDEYDPYADDYYEDDYYEDDFYEDDYEEKPRKRTASGGSSGGSGKKKKKKKKFNVILFIVEILILVAVIGLLYLVTRVDKAERVELNQEEIIAQVPETVKKDAETGAMKGYRNIALFGVDSTKGELAGGNTRSDSIMILSLNQDTGEIRLVSVYRDTYLNLGNDSYNKCNAAYAKGGPTQAVQMLNMNLDLMIEDYVTIGFKGLSQVVDRLGGLEVDVDSAELPHLNNYQLTMSEELGYPYEALTEPGVQHLNGLQATAYCRIRYTAGDDFKRAERQREILMKVIDKAKQTDPATLSLIIGDVSENVVTSLDLQEILDMAADAAKMNVVGNDGFPQADLRDTGNLGGSKGDCVLPRDLEKNVVWLHHFLFNDEDYTVSEEVLKINEKIHSDTDGRGRAD